MNTIVNVTGLALKCLETSDGDDIKKQKIKEYKRKYYTLNREKVNQYLKKEKVKNQKKDI
jgi:hypothetical protein